MLALSAHRSAFRRDCVEVAKGRCRPSLGLSSRQTSGRQFVDGELEMRMQLVIDVALDTNEATGDPDESFDPAWPARVGATRPGRHAMARSTVAVTATAYRFQRVTSARSCFRPAVVSE